MFIRLLLWWVDCGFLFYVLGWVYLFVWGLVLVVGGFVWVVGVGGCVCEFW